MIQSGGKVESVGLELSEAVAGNVVDPDEHLWRSLTGSRRDLPEITHQRAQEICFTLAQQNPLGHRMTELIRDYVVGDGISWEAQNPFVGELVEEFWEDGINDLEQRNQDWPLELGMYGELIPEAFTGPISGITRLGYIDPSQVKKVDHLAGNPLVRNTVWIREKGAGHKGKPLQIIRDRGNGFLEGDVFFFSVNSPSNATRGWPDLLHIADWLDAFDQMLWEVAERSRLARTFIWDVELEGNDTNIDAWLRKHGTPPRSGTIRAHNKGETWSAVAPTLGSFEASAEAQTLMKHISASSGWPSHWLSGAEDVNRATAREMGQPTVRRLSRRQKYWLRCLTTMLRYVLEQAEVSGRLLTENGRVPVFAEGKATGELKKPIQLVQLQAPGIEPRDDFRAAQMFVQTANAMAMAEKHGWFEESAKRQILALVLSKMGFDYQPTDEPMKPEKTEPEREPAALSAV
ncbi:MAG: hypothetical protein WD739_07330 [Actinomycetota bacterium]